ncbi:neocarzinostatin apoprotein domain-containing protein [Streptomyces aurantiacus]|uniref:neocarzinostatin apoprotein domain-containing protein n=1 Tax=Streptomyces aurantiacus TaxID=47760 RepID=UPI0027D85E93|nr:neocarzinostatin apoprotein domain-containing protein [Streptomyces aurantiacus]
MVAVVLALVLFPPAGAAASAAEGPKVELSKSHAGTGGSITVSGTGWRANALLMMLVCGQSSTERGVIGGTNSCANADGRAVTTDAKGRFSKKLPVAEPPEPCPCVVHVATVTGAKAEADAPFLVAGHDVEPLPKQDSGGRLSVLTDTRLDGSSGLLTWFGAPPSRRLVFTVGNVGTAAVKNPVFQVGTSHGVFAPQWEEQQWRGTIGPGKKARITLPVELTAGAHGDYTVSLKFGGKVLAEQPWGVGRPWGVTLFWILVCVVVPGALFRIGMAVVDRIRPRGPSARGRRFGGGGGGGRSGRPGRGAHGVRRGGLRLPDVNHLTFGALWKRTRTRTRNWPPRVPKFTVSSAFKESDAGTSTGTNASTGASTSTSTRARTDSALPWFTPDTDPRAAEADQLSAPHENTSTTSTRKGNT